MEWNRILEFIPLSYDPEVFYTYLGVFAILLMFEAVLLFFRKKKFSTYDEMTQRVRSWWKIFGIFFVALLLGKLGVVLLFSLVSALVFWEFTKVLQIDKTSKIPLSLIYLTIPLQYFFVYSQNYHLFIIFTPVLFHFFLAFVFIIRQQVKGFVRVLGTLQWGAFLCVFCLSHIAYFINFDDLRTEEIEPLGLMTFVIVVTQSNDVFQFLFGKFLGQHKILPIVSPKKTYEGFLGGVFGSLCLSYFIGPYLTRLDAMESMYSGVLLSVCGFLGDLFMSSIKRDRGIKDFGKILPGHGGILDRVDSLIISAPIFLHFYRMYFRSYIGL